MLVITRREARRLGSLASLLLEMMSSLLDTLADGAKGHVRDHLS